MPDAAKSFCKRHELNEDEIVDTIQQIFFAHIRLTPKPSSTNHHDWRSSSFITIAGFGEGDIRPSVVELSIGADTGLGSVHMKKTTTMVFNKQEEKYDNWKNLESTRLRGSEESIDEGEEQGKL